MATKTSPGFHRPTYTIAEMNTLEKSKLSKTRPKDLPPDILIKSFQSKAKPKSNEPHIINSYNIVRVCECEQSGHTIDNYYEPPSYSKPVKKETIKVRKPSSSPRRSTSDHSDVEENTRKIFQKLGVDVAVEYEEKKPYLLPKSQADNNMSLKDYIRDLDSESRRKHLRELSSYCLRYASNLKRIQEQIMRQEAECQAKLSHAPGFTERRIEEAVHSIKEKIRLDADPKELMSVSRPMLTNLTNGDYNWKRLRTMSGGNRLNPEAKPFVPELVLPKNHSDFRRNTERGRTTLRNTLSDSDIDESKQLCREPNGKLVSPDVTVSIGALSTKDDISVPYENLTIESSRPGRSRSVQPFFENEQGRRGYDIAPPFPFWHSPRMPPVHVPRPHENMYMPPPLTDWAVLERTHEFLQKVPEARPLFRLPSLYIKSAGFRPNSSLIENQNRQRAIPMTNRRNYKKLEFSGKSLDKSTDKSNGNSREYEEQETVIILGRDSSHGQSTILNAKCSPTKPETQHDDSKALEVALECVDDAMGKIDFNAKAIVTAE